MIKLDGVTVTSLLARCHAIVMDWTKLDPSTRRKERTSGQLRREIEATEAQ